MLNKIPTPMAAALMIAVIGAVGACYSDEIPQPPTPSTMSLQPLPQPSSLVGTVPVSRIEERAVTPTETVGAAAN
jgi:hypothetical protein